MMLSKKEGNNNMKTKLGRLYNASRKEEFIKSKTSESYRNILYWLFDSTFDVENRKSKDIHNFNLEDMKDVFETRKVNENTAKTMITQIREYINWSMRKGYCFKSVNPLDKKFITEEFIQEISKVKDKLFTIHEIEELLELDEFNPERTIEFDNYLPLHNYQDRAMIALIFFGVSGSNWEDVLNAKIDDVDFENETIHIPSKNKTIRINKEIAQLLKKSNQEQIYDGNKLETSPKSTEWRYSYHNTPYILKRTYFESKYNQEEEKLPIADFVLRSRLRSLGKYLGESLTANKIQQSGMIFMTSLVYKKYGKLSYETLEDVFKRYDMEDASKSFKSQKITWLKKMVAQMYGE